MGDISEAVKLAMNPKRVRRSRMLHHPMKLYYRSHGLQYYQSEFTQMAYMMNGETDLFIQKATGYPEELRNVNVLWSYPRWQWWG